MARKRSKHSGSALNTVRFRDRVLKPSRIAEIKKLIRSHRKANRSELAELLCRAWKWRRPNGELSVYACRSLLLRLDKRGYIKLPPPKTRPGKRKPATRTERGEHWNAQPLPLSGEDVDLHKVVVRLIERHELSRWREAMGRFHYLGDAELVGENLRYVAEGEAGWLALLGWGAAVLKSRHREAYVGWNEKTKYQRLHLVTNNVRFLILPWARVPRLASFVLARNLRRLSDDWQARYGHPILLAETFIDLKRFQGTCYRAANWIHLGQTRGMKRKGAGYETHGEKKALFVYPLHRRAREILSAPFPSPEIMRRHSMQSAMIDVNKLPLEGKDGLIELLRQISDPRHRQGIRHPITSVLVLAVMAALSGMRSYEAVAEWAKDVPKDLLKLLRCWCHQAPSEPTFRRVLQSVNAVEIDEKVSAWLARRGLGDAIALDGKTLRGSGDGDDPACHLLAAITHESGLVVAQERVDEKSNEITAAKPLLKDLDLEGRTVTADAMHTQKEFARHLVEDKGADYVFIAKDNQPTLLEDIKTVNWDSFFPSGEYLRQGPRPNRDAKDLRD